MSSNHAFKSVIGEDTTVIVAFRHEPEETAVLSGPCVYPGSPENVVITSVLRGDDDLQDDLNPDCLDRLEQECWQHMKDCGLRQVA